jgi:hypothetical protein
MKAWNTPSVPKKRRFFRDSGPIMFSGFAPHFLTQGHFKAPQASPALCWERPQGPESIAPSSLCLSFSRQSGMESTLQLKCLCQKIGRSRAKEGKRHAYIHIYM